MKIVQFVLLSFALLSINSCAKIDQNLDVPQCVEKKIKKILNKPVQNPTAQVWKWQDDVNTYYYFTSACCDQYNYLFNDQCEIICAPDGGFTGGGDGLCLSFQGEVVQTLVWEDPRE